MKSPLDLVAPSCPLLILQKLGKENPIEPQPPSPDDLATICYTSGTTGAYKFAFVGSPVCGVTLL